MYFIMQNSRSLKEAFDSVCFHGRLVKHLFSEYTKFELNLSTPWYLNFLIVTLSSQHLDLLPYNVTLLRLQAWVVGEVSNAIHL